MRALRVTELSGPSGVALVDIDEPAENGSDVRIAVAAAGITWPDLLLTQGAYQMRPDVPFTLGAEAAGTVLSAPSGSGLAVGQRLAFAGLGAFQEVVSVPVDAVFAVPDSLALETAASMPLNYLTAHFALVVRGRVGDGDWVLVHGAGGGLGLACVQIARACGARVIAVASDEERRRAALDAGASHAIAVDGFRDAVGDLTGGHGVDVIADPVGGDRVTDSLRCLAPLGRLVVLGFTGGDIPTVKLNRLLLNNTELIGIAWGGYVFDKPGYMQWQWDEVIAMLTAAGIAPVAPRVVPATQIADELRAMGERRLVGKVVGTW